MPEVASRSWGQRIRFQYSDTGIAAVIEAGFDRLLVERSTDNGISYAALGVPSDRLVLEAGKSDYVVNDPMGDGAYLYRVRYAREGSDEVGDASEAIEGAGAAVQSILTPNQLKARYLFGLDLTDDAGNEIPDSTYEHYIYSAIATISTELDIPILPTTFIGETHDYYRADYAEYNIIQLENYPLISVEQFDVQYPSGQSLVRYPIEWIREDMTHGLLRVVPTAGTLTEVLVGAGGSFLPAIYSGRSHVPDLFSIDYTAGFETVPRNIVDIIGKLASMGPFNILGDLIAGAGIANLSVSLDGLSQTIGTTSSATNAGYGARLIQYGKEIKEALPMLIRFYKGIRMTVA